MRLVDLGQDRVMLSKATTLSARRRRILVVARRVRLGEDIYLAIRVVGRLGIRAVIRLSADSQIRAKLVEALQHSWPTIDVGAYVLGGARRSISRRLQRFRLVTALASRGVPASGGELSASPLAIVITSHVFPVVVLESAVLVLDDVTELQLDPVLFRRRELGVAGALPSLGRRIGSITSVHCAVLQLVDPGVGPADPLLVGPVHIVALDEPVAVGVALLVYQAELEWCRLIEAVWASDKVIVVRPHEASLLWCARDMLGDS